MRAYERLLKYVQFPTASCSDCPDCPSSQSQFVLAHALVEELKDLGVTDAFVDEHCYLYGTIPANIPDWNGDVIAFISHMDVVDDVPYENIKTRVITKYEGGDIVLNEELGIKMRPEEYTFLNGWIGKSIVVTDGTTLLGADDKAGVAEILTMVEYFHEHPDVPHGTIKVAFTPDEEIGRGADLFDVPGFGADFAYTVDGGGFGEVEYETFNAASAKVEVKGYNIHPGSAKDKMKNAGLIAMEFDALLPSQERPVHTKGRQGFYHLTEMAGTVEAAHLSYILRDHDRSILEERKAKVQQVAESLNSKYGPGTVTVTVKDSYYNMVEQIKPHWHLIETAYDAVKALGGTPRSVPVRGGTDGSRLSFMGLPCPNLGTGARNAHGKMECACVEEMDQCTELLISIVKAYTTAPKHPK